MTTHIANIGLNAIYTNAWLYAAGNRVSPFSDWGRSDSGIHAAYDSDVQGKPVQAEFDLFVSSFASLVEGKASGSATDIEALTFKPGVPGSIRLKTAPVTLEPDETAIWVSQSAVSIAPLAATTANQLLHLLNSHPHTAWADWTMVDPTNPDLPTFTASPKPGASAALRMWLTRVPQEYVPRSRMGLGNGQTAYVDGRVRRTPPNCLTFEQWGEPTLLSSSQAEAEAAYYVTRLRDNLRRGLGYHEDAQRRAEDTARREAGIKSRRNFEAFRDQHERNSDHHLFDKLRIANRGTKSSRRWGIEVETGAGGGIDAPRGWDRRDDGSLESAYGNKYVDPEDCDYSDLHIGEIEVTRVDNGQTITIENPDYQDPDYCDYCGDIEQDYDDDCVEFVSPILTSVHSRGLEAILTELEPRPITHTAGVHVHVEASDLTPPQVAQLLLAYDRLEPIIEASYQREERGYCKRRSTSEILEIVREYKRNPKGNPRDMRHGDRYVSVNLIALESHGTIEFRAMGPVYNYHTLSRWALFCREMVNLAASGVTAKDWAKVSDFAGIEAMFNKYGKEYPLAAEATTPAEPELALVG